MPTIDNQLGRLQASVEQLQINHQRAEKSRDRIFKELELIRGMIKPIFDDMPKLKATWQQYEIDKITARRFVYALTAIAATVGITLSEVKIWLIKWIS